MQGQYKVNRIMRGQCGGKDDDVEKDASNVEDKKVQKLRKVKEYNENRREGIK
jgi:hypothetical protein